MAQGQNYFVVVVDRESGEDIGRSGYTFNDMSNAHSDAAYWAGQYLSHGYHYAVDVRDAYSGHVYAQYR